MADLRQSCDLYKIHSSVYDEGKMVEPAPDSLIQAAGLGDRQALDRVMPELYGHLRDIATNQMARERSGHLLQTTALIHEAYLRLSEQRRSDWRDRGSFLAAASVVMRRVLIDDARRDRAQKRGGGLKKRSISDSRLAFDDGVVSVIEIHEALETLESFAPDQAKALELMIFGGLTGEETAAALGVSPSTIDRKVRAAKAWLRRELSEAT